jgi:hypothetical protein
MIYVLEINVRLQLTIYYTCTGGVYVNIEYDRNEFLSFYKSI